MYIIFIFIYVCYTTCFILLKLGLGITAYLKSKWNLLDHKDPTADDSAEGAHGWTPDLVLLL